MTDQPWGTTTHYATHNVTDTSGQTGGGSYLPLAGGTMTGQVNFYEFNTLMQAFAGDSVALQGKTASNAARWTVNFIDGSAESGSDSGSNFDIRRFHDAGGAPVKCLTISRATGVVSLTQGLNLQPATNASPQDGDLWYDGTHLNFRHGSTTTVLV